VIHCPKAGERVRIVCGNRPEYLVPFHGRVGVVLRKVKNAVVGEAVVLKFDPPLVGVGAERGYGVTDMLLVPLRNAAYEEFQSKPPPAECV